MRDASSTPSNITRNPVRTRMDGMTRKTRILRDHRSKVTERDNVGRAIECIRVFPSSLHSRVTASPHIPCLPQQHPKYSPTEWCLRWMSELSRCRTRVVGAELVFDVAESVVSSFHVRFIRASGRANKSVI